MPITLSDLLNGKAFGRGKFAEVPRTGPAAIVTMELQRGIMGDLSALPDLAAACDAVGVIPNAARLLRSAWAADMPVVHCICGYRPDGAGSVVNTPMHSALLRRPGHLIAGTPATEIVADLGPEPGDIVVARYHGVSPFAGTTLDATLRGIGVRVLVVVGVSVNIGVLGLCIEAVNNGYQVVLATDAVAGVPETYAADVIKNTLSLIATLATVDDLVAAIEEKTHN